jgi:hypothetical protein
MVENKKSSTDEVERLKEHAASLALEAEKAAETAAKAVEEHAFMADEHAIEYGEHPYGYSPEDRADIVKPVAGLEPYLTDLTGMFDRLLKYLNNLSLTNAERFRLLGSGVRRLGFIEKVADTAEELPQYIPPFFDLARLRGLMRDIEILRVIRTTAQSIDRLANDALLVDGNDAFQAALMYYNTVKEAARRNVPGAMEVFKMLELFFRRGKRTDEEPTEKELLRDVKSLLHDRKDGEIVIKNEKPHTAGGKHEVMDETHFPKGEWKKTEEGQII